MDRLRVLTKTDGVAESLRAEIIRGTFAPGTQLRQEDVAERLGVSSTPVREAFGILEAEGFLERRPHRGVVVVRPPNVTDIEEAYELRALVEGIAIRKLLERGTREVLDELAANLRTSGALLGARDLHRFREAGSEFHRILARGSGSDLVAEVHALMVKRTLFTNPLNRTATVRIQRDHEEILSAIRKGARERAERLLSDHLGWVAGRVRRTKTVTGDTNGIAI